MSNRDELEKQAQAKLADAWRLIHEAGDLAKEGQFSLHFGEVGDFVPRSYTDPSLLRERAIEELRENGRPNDRIRVAVPISSESPHGYRYDEVPNTSWDEMDECEREDAIEAEIDSIRENMDIPSELRKYGADGVADEWWAPSRC